MRSSSRDRLLWAWKDRAWHQFYVIFGRLSTTFADFSFVNECIFLFAENLLSFPREIMRKQGTHIYVSFRSFRPLWANAGPGLAVNITPFPPGSDIGELQGITAPPKWELASVRIRRRGANFRLHSPISQPKVYFCTESTILSPYRHRRRSSDTQWHPFCPRRHPSEGIRRRFCQLRRPYGT